MGICAQQKTNSDEFLSGIGCKASDIEGVPRGFEIIHLPEYIWTIFTCVGPIPKSIQEMWEKIYREWLPHVSAAATFQVHFPLSSTCQLRNSAPSVRLCMLPWDNVKAFQASRSA